MLEILSNGIFKRWTTLKSLTQVFKSFFTTENIKQGTTYTRQFIQITTAAKKGTSDVNLLFADTVWLK